MPDDQRRDVMGIRPTKVYFRPADFRVTHRRQIPAERDNQPVQLPPPPAAEELLMAARRALRGYQYGTGSRDVAQGVADAIDDYFNYHGGDK